MSKVNFNTNVVPMYVMYVCMYVPMRGARSHEGPMLYLLTVSHYLIQKAVVNAIQYNTMLGGAQTKLDDLVCSDNRQHPNGGSMVCCGNGRLLGFACHGGPPV